MSQTMNTILTDDERPKLPEAPAQNGHLADDERVAALCTLSYAAGMKAGWNYCASEDNEGFERSQKSVGEAIRILKAHRAAPEAPAQADEGKVVVTWNHDRTRILAVTRQNAEGQILKVIAEAPALPAEVREALKEAREALVDVKYGLEGARIWGGMDWTYNPLHPVKYLPLRDKTESAIARIDALGGVE